MKKLLVPLILITSLAFSVGGCAQFRTALDVVTAVGDAQVNPTAVIVAANTFNGVEASMTNYLRLPRCTLTNRPVCRDPVATAQIIPAVRSGRIARDKLVDFMENNPGKLGSSGLFNALTSATSTLQEIKLQYSVKQ